MQDAPKVVWSIPYISVAFFPTLKQNFLVYRSSEVFSCPDCIFEIYQLWQSGFSRVYSNCCCSCSLEPEIIKIGQSSHKMYSNNIVNFQESMTMLNARTKKVWKLIACTSYIYKNTGGLEYTSDSVVQVQMFINFLTNEFGSSTREERDTIFKSFVIILY